MYWFIMAILRTPRFTKLDDKNLSPLRLKSLFSQLTSEIFIALDVTIFPRTIQNMLKDTSCPELGNI